MAGKPDKTLSLLFALLEDPPPDEEEDPVVVPLPFVVVELELLLADEELLLFDFEFSLILLLRAFKADRFDLLGAAGLPAFTAKHNIS